MKPFLGALLTLAILVPAAAQESKPIVSLQTVVIDPGHGGKDAGCVSRDKKTYEKYITLDISKRLAGKISAGYPEVSVKMTRTSDKFVELENRAVFANRAGANLFISIHVNAVEKGSAAKGFSIHCLGQSARKGNDLYSKNLDLVRRENSVIKLEDNYETKYQGFDPSDPQSYIIFSLMQNSHLSQSLSFADEVASEMSRGPISHNRGVSQDPFWVLWRTAMPSVLIEVGFMTNPEDLATMRTEKGREGIAEAIYRAFCNFKAKYDGAALIPVPAEVPAVAEEPEKADEITYGIQILAIGREMSSGDKYFKGYRPVAVKAGKMYKYVVCTSASLDEVRNFLPEVKKKFPDCYIVRIEENNTVPVK